MGYGKHPTSRLEAGTGNGHQLAAACALPHNGHGTGDCCQAGSLERFLWIIPVPCSPGMVLLPVLRPQRDHSSAVCPRGGLTLLMLSGTNLKSCKV